MFFCCCCFFLSLSLHLSFSPPLLLFDATISFTQFVHVDTADKPYLTKPATRVDRIQPSKETSCHAFVLSIFQVRHLSYVETRREQETSIVTRHNCKIRLDTNYGVVETFKETEDMSVLCPLFVHFFINFLSLVNVTFLVCLSFSILLNYF